jgi:hypothetical protein
MPLALRAHVKYVQFGCPAELWASKEMNEDIVIDTLRLYFYSQIFVTLPLVE